MTGGRSLRSLLVGAVVVVVALVAIASAGWGCVAMATLELTPTTVEPGQQVEFAGSYYHDGTPVVLRWDSIDGPALATVGPAELIDFRHGYWRKIGGGFTVPADAAPGAHVVVATQEASPGRPTWGVPSRAVVQVGAAGPPEAKEPAGAALTRLSKVDIKGGGGARVLPLVAVGVASAVAVAGGASLGGRRRSHRRAASAST